MLAEHGRQCWPHCTVHPACSAVRKAPWLCSYCSHYKPNYKLRLRFVTTAITCNECKRHDLRTRRTLRRIARWMVVAAETAASLAAEYLAARRVNQSCESPGRIRALYAGLHERWVRFV